jgi:hypothetical protein
MFRRTRVCPRLRGSPQSQKRPHESGYHLGGLIVVEEVWQIFLYKMTMKMRIHMQTKCENVPIDDAAEAANDMEREMRTCTRDNHHRLLAVDLLLHLDHLPPGARGLEKCSELKTSSRLSPWHRGLNELPPILLHIARKGVGTSKYPPHSPMRGCTACYT